MAYAVGVYSVQVQAKAARQLRKIAKKYRDDYEAVIAAAQTLKDWPNVEGVKALTNHRYGYRMRVGRFRIFFDVGRSIKIVYVEEVERRDDHTY
ncbi:type II toxin-antitoxin system RelE/ParE family toxin [soil metagenome]